MMRALQCDKCGAYYRVNQDGAGKIFFSNGTEERTIYADDKRDLCPDCYEKAKELFFYTTERT